MPTAQNRYYAQLVREGCVSCGRQFEPGEGVGFVNWTGPEHDPAVEPDGIEGLVCEPRDQAEAEEREFDRMIAAGWRPPERRPGSEGR